jgi:hypothetical protein
MPAEPDVAEGVHVAGLQRQRALLGLGPLATTRMGANCRAKRASTYSQTLSMSNGRSG